VTTAEIQARGRPDWNLFEHGAPSGESPAEISDRVDQILPRLRAIAGNVALFSHGHFLRVLAARWIGLPARDGQHLLLQTASLSILASEHNNPAEPAIALWNAGVDQLRAAGEQRGGHKEA
jgi:probable phosphoglycerate mutase